MYDNMSYMWDEFNIKTFPAETIVYRDGVFCKDLSTLSDTDIKNKYNKPVHIIYVGEISNTCKLNINILAENQPVFLSINIKNKKPAFLNIFIKEKRCLDYIFYSALFNVLLHVYCKLL